MSDLVLIANAGDGTVSGLRLDREAGRLEPLATSGGLSGCGTFAVDEARGLVFAAYKGDPPGIAMLRLDRGVGSLREVRRRDTGGSLTYLTLTSDGRFLLGVSYGQGQGWVWPVTGGEVAEPVAQFAYRNLHCVVLDGHLVYAVSLGEDLIAQFTLAGDGTLAPMDPPTVAAPAGSGPRHLALDGPNAYVMTEFSGRAVRFARDHDGRLSLAESVDVVPPGSGLGHSSLGKDPKQEALVWGADVWLAGPADARWLLTSERSTSTITSTPLGEGGQLGEPAAYTSTQAQPRGFAVTADGRYVVAVGEKSLHAELCRLEPDGSLTALDTAPIGAGANWVRILP